MMNPRKIETLRKTATCAVLLSLSLGADAHTPHKCPDGFPDAPTLSGHVEQADINSRKLRFSQIFDAGERHFVAVHNTCDGQGRPATTGAGDKREPDQPDFIRTSAPDSSSCAGCHAQPRAGGGGDFVANVFVLAQAEDPVIEHVLPGVTMVNGVEQLGSNERNTLGMHGSGAIEMLAREMTETLQVQAENLPDGHHTLRAKGVDFDITIADGQVVASKGVDSDLVVKPFHQAGVVPSLRVFTVNAFNHHHGMQPEERFDLDPAKGDDFDEDGVGRELTVGDMTATVIWQAALGVPGQLLPQSWSERRAVKRGEVLFEQIGCADCHVPQMELNSRHFVEPSPFNPAGTCGSAGGPSACDFTFSFDMTKQGEKPRLERKRGGRAIVRAYTDLKRHNLCDAADEPNAIRFFCNEQRDQGRPAQDGRPGTEFFITRKLWDVGNSAPYGHRGDITTITEAIWYHGGEGTASREAFETLSADEQASVVKFLKTLQVLPEGSPRVVIGR